MPQKIAVDMGADAPFLSIKLPMSDAGRASLLAVRAAQDAARERARRETVRARIWCGAIVGVIALGVILVGPRVGRRAGAPSAAVAAEPMTAPSMALAAPAANTLTRAAALDAQPLPAAALPVVAEPAVTAPSPTLRADARAESGDCNVTFGQRRWRMAAETCARAFQARPQDASLALTVAHAHHARGHYAEAGEWARRSIALDATAAEAFVILAHAESRAGNAQAASEAYRRYLALAPRGWHSAEARAALRAHPAEEQARAVRRSEGAAADANGG